LLEGDRARGSRPAADLVHQTLQVRQLRPGLLAQNVRDQARPAPYVHVDDRIGPAEHVVPLAEALVDDAEMSVGLEYVAVDGIGQFLRGVSPEVNGLA